MANIKRKSSLLNLRQPSDPQGRHFYPHFPPGHRLFSSQTYS
jgi:hypothetical protein